MDNTLPIKDISTPILLGYLAEIQKKQTKSAEDSENLNKISLELKSRGVDTSWISN